MSLLWVPGPLPGLNEIIDACLSGKSITTKGGKRFKTNPWSPKKAKWGKTIGDLAHEQEFRIDGTCWTYLCIEEERRRDKSNVLSGAMKVIEDALQDCKLLKNDGWKQVRDIVPYFAVGSPGVLVSVGDFCRLYQSMKGYALERGLQIHGE